MKIRNAETSDAPELAEMLFELRKHIHGIEGSVKPLEKYVRQKLKDERYKLLVVEKEKEIVATIGLTLKQGKIAILMDAYVKPEFRRQGITKMMEEEVYRLAKENGKNVIELDVMRSNQQGWDTWHTLDYQPFKLIMRKKIN
ncbi:GNAT family N-acetyltransferase [Candidatus Thorarchaeota archaeon]|nr:MAG: GNAT family N-acetyltransferase [Candidatus Thorarchaeota archaeon]